MTDKNCHFIGIGGIGMSGLARIALQKGCSVSGSDLRKSAVVESLEKMGAHIFVGQSASQVPSSGKVIFSTDIKTDNPEYAEALKKGLVCLHRSHFLKELMEGFSPLLVTGTHGKTTTSSLLAHVLRRANLDPAFSIGGIVQSLQSNGGYGLGKYFVAEADESDGSFLVYDPIGAIITNIDLDHLNYWENEENLLKGFENFCHKVEDQTLLFWCKDDLRLSSLHLSGNSYGFSKSADLCIENPSYEGWMSFYDIRFKGKHYQKIQIPMIGEHNILNSAAVFGLCLQIGIEENVIREALLTFLGVQRRVEKKGEAKGICVYDDYAHHPAEIATTLAGLKKACPRRRLLVLFQPHRFTRTRDCFQEFGPALSLADFVILTDVYSAGESPIENIDSIELQKLIAGQGCNCLYVSKEELLARLLFLSKPGDVVVSMGAGDITQVGPKFLEALQ